MGENPKAAAAAGRSFLSGLFPLGVLFSTVTHVSL